MGLHRRVDVHRCVWGRSAIRIALALSACLAVLPSAALAAQTIPAASVIHGQQVQAGHGIPGHGPAAIPLRVENPSSYAQAKLRANQRAGLGARSQSSAQSSTSAAFGPLAAVFGGLNAGGLSAAQQLAAFPTNDFTPPDTTGAIGPSDYVEFTNSEVAAYDRTNLTMRTGSPADLSTFVGGTSVCDPQIKYDPQTSRWFYVAIRCDATGEAAGTMYLGFSKSSDPHNFNSTGWCSYSYSSFGSNFEDYPKLGLDGTHIMIGVNQFDGTTGAFNTARILALLEPAAGVISSCPGAPTMTTFGSTGSPLAAGGDEAFTPEPATVGDSSTGGYVVAADFVTFSNMMVWQVSGTAPITLTALGDPAVPAFTTPPNIPQPGTSDQLDSSDTRLTQANAEADPTLPGDPEAIWTQHTVDSGSGGSVVRWYEIVPGSPPTVRQTGTVSDPSGFAFNGAIAPTANGGAIINYNTGSASQFVQITARSRVGSDTLGTMEDVLGSPLASSGTFDNDFSCPSVTPSDLACRWGDYAGASIDPNNPDVVWGSNQFNGPQATSHRAQWATQIFALVLTDQPPSAAFTVSGAPAVPGALVSFDGASSTDPDGSITSYSWNFGDGASASGVTASHAYGADGTYTVTLTVTDSSGNTNTATQTVTIDELPSASLAVTTAHPVAGASVSFDGASSSDPDGSITSYSWNFGDGTSGSGATPSHVYAAPGSYTVTLTVTDSSGNTKSVAQTVTVDELPTASFAVTTAHPGTGAPVSFDGTSSRDPDGAIASYAWSFGDGSTGGGAKPTHTYKVRGTYSVTLNVSDFSGGRASRTIAVTVAQAGVISKIRRASRGRALLVTVTSSGTLFVGSSRITVHKAGTVKAKVRLTRKQRRLLAHHHRLRLKVKVRFVPLAGPPMTKHFRDTIRP